MIVACNDQQGQNTVNADSDKQKTQRINEEDIANLKYTEYVLSASATEAVADWQTYQELMMQMDYLKKADFSFFNGETELMSNFIKDLRLGMPSGVSKPSIVERLVVVETKLQKLHSTLKLSNNSKEETLTNIKELLVANSNLNFQMNKKFELESQIIEDPTINQASEIKTLQD